MLSFSFVGYGSSAVFLLPDLDSQRACRLHRITAVLIRPDLAHCMAGGVNSADRLNLVIDSIRSDTHRGRSPIGPVPADGAEGWLSADTNLVYPLLGHRHR
jgi:hypothetical protein